MSESNLIKTVRFTATEQHKTVFARQQDSTPEVPATVSPVAGQLFLAAKISGGAA